MKHTIFKNGLICMLNVLLNNILHNVSIEFLNKKRLILYRMPTHLVFECAALILILEVPYFVGINVFIHRFSVTFVKSFSTFKLIFKYNECNTVGKQVNTQKIYFIRNMPIAMSLK